MHSMELLKTFLIVLYVSLTFRFFLNWLKTFNCIPISSVEDSFLSIVILFIVTVLWPFVVPIFWVSALGVPTFAQQLTEQEEIKTFETKIQHLEATLPD